MRLWILIMRSIVLHWPSFLAYSYICFPKVLHFKYGWKIWNQIILKHGAPTLGLITWHKQLQVFEVMSGHQRDIWQKNCPCLKLACICWMLNTMYLARVLDNYKFLLVRGTTEDNNLHTWSSSFSQSVSFWPGLPKIISNEVRPGNSDFAISKQLKVEINY